MASIDNVLARGIEKLSAHRCPYTNSAHEATLLLEHVLQKTREWIVSHGMENISSESEQRLYSLIARRLTHEPLAYIVEKWHFFGRDFFVSPHVLIPRPATEQIVEQAIAWLSTQPTANVYDIGTGSGCIAMTIACETTHRVVATDISQQALVVAKQNASNHHVEKQIEFVANDAKTLFHPPKNSDVPLLIIANLPYIPTLNLQKLSPDITGYEPHIALDGGVDGLDLYKKLLHDIKKSSPSHFALFFEILPEQFDILEKETLRLWPDVTHEKILSLDRVVIGAYITRKI